MDTKEQNVKEPSEEEITLEDVYQTIIRRVLDLAEDAAEVSSVFSQLMGRLPEILEKQPAARQTVVFDVLAAAFDAFDEEEEAAGAFLIQIAVILIAGYENDAEKCLRNVAGRAKNELMLPRS